MQAIVQNAYGLVLYVARVATYSTGFNLCLHKITDLVRDSAAGYVALFNYLFP